MSSVSNSGLPHRLVSGATWVFAIAGAAAWLAALIYELQTGPDQLAARPIQDASSPQVQAAAPGTRADQAPASYWVEVGKVAGAD